MVTINQIKNRKRGNTNKTNGEQLRIEYVRVPARALVLQSTFVLKYQQDESGYVLKRQKVISTFQH